jgi:hypothetical protein
MGKILYMHPRVLKSVDYDCFRIVADMDPSTSIEAAEEYRSLAGRLSEIKDTSYRGLKEIPLGPHTEYWARFMDNENDKEFCLHLFTVTC